MINDTSSGWLSEAAHLRIFSRIEAITFRNIVPPKPEEQPAAIFIAGQPGAGKTALSETALAEFPPERAVLIDVDALRDWHPNYRSWRSDPLTEKSAAAMCHADASAWSKALVRQAVARKCNIVVDGTLSNTEAMHSLFSMLKEAGYQVSVKALAVRKDVSQLGILERFEAGKAKAMPRWISSDVHAIAYSKLPATLQAIEQSPDLYNARVGIYDRSGRRLYDNFDRADNIALTAKQALDHARKAPLSPHEESRYQEIANKVISALVQRHAPQEEIQAVERLAVRLAQRNEHPARLPARPGVSEAPKPLSTDACTDQKQLTSIGGKMSQTEYSSALKKVGGQGKGRIDLPGPGGVYQGRIIQSSASHLVQQVEKRIAIAHDVAMLLNADALLAMATDGTLPAKAFRFEYDECSGWATEISVQKRLTGNVHGKVKTVATGPNLPLAPGASSNAAVHDADKIRSSGENVAPTTDRNFGQAQNSAGRVLPKPTSR